MPRILVAEVDPSALQHEPPGALMAESCGDPAEVEAHHHPAIRQAVHRDPVLHGPHEQAHFEVFRRELPVCPPLSPLAEAVHHLAERLASLGELIVPASAAGEGAARDHAGVLELAQPLGQERAGDERHAVANVVEPVAAGQELAQDDGRPALRKYLRCHRDRAELAIAPHARMLGAARRSGKSILWSWRAPAALAWWAAKEDLTMPTMETRPIDCLAL